MWIQSKFYGAFVLNLKSRDGRPPQVESDARFWKFLGIAVGCISLGTAIGPLLSFRQHCTRSTTEGIHMRNGPGFICLSIAGSRVENQNASAAFASTLELRFVIPTGGVPQRSLRAHAPLAPRARRL